MSARHFYLYGRVSDPGSTAARECALRLVADLRDGTGVSGRLPWRHDDAGTWLKVYENVAHPEEFERALNAAVAARNFGVRLAAGSRRVVERFEVC